VEALALVDSGQEFDLVLSALLMTEIDGLTLLQRIKERHPEMPLIFVTAINDRSVMEEATRRGAYDYLLKPFERVQLLAAVFQALAEHQRAKSQIAQNELRLPPQNSHNRVEGFVAAILLAALLLWLGPEGWRALDTLGWIPHARDTEVHFDGQWLVGEYRLCWSRNGISDLDCPKSDDVEANLKAGFWNPTAHTLPVTYWGRVDRPTGIGAAEVRWRCQREESLLTCKATN
jgi:hypothetical protein